MVDLEDGGLGFVWIRNYSIFGLKHQGSVDFRDMFHISVTSGATVANQHRLSEHDRAGPSCCPLVLLPSWC